MSIEQTLERIAVALEKIVALKPSDLGAPRTASEVQAIAPAVKKGKGVAPAPVAAPVIEVDPFAAPGEAAVPEVTFPMLSEKLQLHAKMYGTPTTIELIKKHGADKAQPKMSSIPTANYAACLAEVEADLAKAKK